MKKLIERLLQAIIVGMFLLHTSGAFADETGVESRPAALVKIAKAYANDSEDPNSGAYGSIVSVGAQSLQRKLANIENRVMGLSQLDFNEDPQSAAEAIYLLEAALFKTSYQIENLSSSQITAFEKSSLLYWDAHIYQALRQYAERQFEQMVRAIDKKFPGPNGKQFRTEDEDGGFSVYLPNYRSEQTLTDEQRALNYQQKEQEFLKKGGSLSEIHIMTKEWIDSLPSYTRVEYVVRASDQQIYVTTGSAGHVLLAAGESVQSAGQMIFIRGKNGKMAMVVVSNGSGNFKPDLYSAKLISMKVASLLSIPETQVVVTKGEPLATQALRIFGKILDTDKQEMQMRVDRLKQVEKSLQKLPSYIDVSLASVGSCSEALTK